MRCSAAISILVVLGLLSLATDSDQLEFLSNTYKKTKDVVSAHTRIAERFISNAPVLMPSFEEVGDFGKQLLLGYPLEAIAAGIHTFCSAAVATNGTEPLTEPDLSAMSYVLMTDSGNASFPLKQPQLLWDSEMFQQNLSTVILVTGWMTLADDTNTAAGTLFQAYRAREEVNFIVLDTVAQLTTLYAWSSFNTNSLGDALGDGLAELVNHVPVKSIHLIGHSLGAHVSGAAGRRFQELKGYSLPRITGLDPANPCFNEGESLSGLSRGDADLVDVIHSNVRVLGKRDPLGDIDFYPNGLNSVQPGCYSVVCSHSRAIKYFAESILPGNERNFVAVKCNGLQALTSGRCRRQTAVMGHSVTNNVKGNFFLRVNPHSPHGRKEDY